MTRTLAMTMDPSVITSQLIDILDSITRDKLRGVSSDGYALTTKDVLLVTLFGYSLLGDSIPLIPEYEVLLKNAFVNAMRAVF
jgi:hypothetical protein